MIIKTIQDGKQSAKTSPLGWVNKRAEIKSMSNETIMFRQKLYDQWEEEQELRAECYDHKRPNDLQGWEVFYASVINVADVPVLNPELSQRLKVLFEVTYPTGATEVIEAIFSAGP